MCVRLIDGGFADLHHPEYWDLGFAHAGLPEDLRAEYTKMTERLADGLKFMEAIGEKSVDQLTRVEFFTSHEGLNLLYEHAQTRSVPRREGFTTSSTHMPWLGDRTRGLDGARVEYFRGIRNPVGVKLGANTNVDEVGALVRTLNPTRGGEDGLDCAGGGAQVRELLPRLIERVEKEKDAGGLGRCCGCATRCTGTR